jgi:hypothetical protein
LKTTKIETRPRQWAGQVYFDVSYISSRTKRKKKNLLFGRGQDSILSFIFFLQTQQTITQAFFWPMEELARGRRYVHEDRPEMSEHLYFIKRENGFDYGLIIDKMERNESSPDSLPLATPGQTCST